MNNFFEDTRRFFYPAIMVSAIFHGALIAFSSQWPVAVSTSVWEGPNTLEVIVVSRPVVTGIEREVMTKEILGDIDYPQNDIVRESIQKPKNDGDSQKGSQLLLGAVSGAKPVAYANAAPSYPSIARRQGWEGTVRLNVLVEKNGKARQVAIEESSGYTILDRAALEAVQQWKFVPAYSGSQPLTSKISVPIQFTLVQE